MSLLDVSRGVDRIRRARLVLDLAELSQRDWLSLTDYAQVRGIHGFAAARRSLYRLRALLARERVVLDVYIRNRTLFARFGTKAIRELVEPDLRPALVCVERLAAKREERPPNFEGVGEVVSCDAIVFDYRTRRKSVSWIAHKQGVGAARVSRVLAAAGQAKRHRSLRFEHGCHEDVVARALAAADRFATLKEIAALLGCSVRTARRFVRRNGRTLPPGRRLVTHVRRIALLDA